MSARLIVANPETNADLVYATRFFAPDPVIYLEQNDEKLLLLSRLEVDRGKREAKVDCVYSYEEFAEPLRKQLKREAKPVEILLAFLRKRRVRKVQVPQDFPIALARQLEANRIKTEPVKEAFFPEREFKSAAEVTAIRKALRITETGMARGIEVLRVAMPDKNGFLKWHNTFLTSEMLRAEIDSAILRAGGVPQNTIVAGGNQACDPHERGHGRLRANTLIILDIFPRSEKTGYFGDMTRTVVRGKANHAQRDLWETVLTGQKMALQSMKPGTDGKKLEEKIRSFFKETGYPTEIKNGRWTGFFHGTGHGLGLEIHESPRFSQTVFQPGQVITVEPGLYFPGLGGVRIEDVALITKTGHSVLSRFPKELEV